MSTTFGDRLYEARICRGMSQRELARKAGVSNAAISRWENNQQEPNMMQLIRVCDAIEVSADWLLNL